MRLHRFYTTEKIGLQKEITIQSAEMVNQVRRVFRLKSGDSVIMFDGSGSDYECRISDFGKESITLDIDSSTRSRFMPEREIVLCAAVVKKDTFEWIVEKATELGVTKIIPIMAERSEKKNLNEARLKKIAVEASEQSGRGTVPVISEIMSLKEVVDYMAKSGGLTSSQQGEVSLKAVAFHLDGEPFDARKINTKNNSLAIFIGPEGGWSENELAMFHKSGVPVVTLGTQVLRAETAVVATLSVIMFGK